MTYKDPVPAVVTPLDDHMGLDIARSLHGHGIPVYGVDNDRQAIGKYSKTCQLIVSPDPQKDSQGYLKFLVDFSLRLNCKPVLFPLSDEHVLTISRNREILKDHYDFVMPANETIEALCTKVGLMGIARDLCIPAPFTLFPQSFAEVEKAARELQYPVILKPGESPQWHDPRIESQLKRGILDGRAKVVLCLNALELKEYYLRLASLNPELVIQEVIPGEDSRLFYVSFYMDRKSRPLAFFAGRKDRVIPIGFGSASFVHSFYDPELIKMGLQILTGTHYQGSCGIEFKKDSRDETYKLIEVNTRFSMWDGLGAKCGVDFAYIAYRDALGLPVEPQTTFRTGVIWLDWQRDLRAALAYRRQGQLTWRAWLASLRGEKMWAIYSSDDWRPGIAFTLSLVKKFFYRLLKV
jgi:predicted ATP-grasp superfamily ATP-dependent carboligase